MRFHYDYTAFPFDDPAAPTADPAPAADEKKYTDKDVDAIKVKAKRDAEARVRAEYEAKAKAADEAAKLARMNAEEKAKYELEKTRAELNALKHANAVASMVSEIRKMGDAAGVAIPDELARTLVGRDAETTKANTDAFLKTLDGLVKSGVEAALNHKAPRAGTRASGTYTRKDWEKETDPVKREKMIRENPDMFRR